MVMGVDQAGQHCVPVRAKHPRLWIKRLQLRPLAHLNYLAVLDGYRPVTDYLLGGIAAGEKPVTTN
jgi:hypothetical protein